MRMLRDEEEAADSILSSVDSDNQRLSPNGETTILRVSHRHGRLLFGWVLKELLDFLDLIREKLIYPFSCFLLDVVLDHGTLGKRVEVLQHLDGVWNS
jgi:hypothetical protein